MVRGAAIGFVVSMLLTTVATWLMLTGPVHAQRAPQHVFSGLVQNAGTPVHQGRISFLDMSGQEVANGDISGGRYKIAIVEPVGRNYSGQAFQISVAFQQRIYERGRLVNWQAGGVTELDLNFSGWKWRQAPSQVGPQPMDRGNDMREKEGEQRLEMERQRMKMEEDMRREQMEMERQLMKRETDMREKEGEERRDMEEDMRREQMEMERERMERDDEMREKEGEERREMERQRMEREDEMRLKEGEERREMERQRMEREEEMRREQMEREEEMRREQMEMERERMGRGQPGVRPVAGESPKSGPSRGLFSNRAAGEATSGIDNVMDPQMLTIIGIALTVLTTGMTLFKGD